MNSTTAEKRERTDIHEKHRKQSPQTHTLETSREAEGELESREAGNQRMRGLPETVLSSVQRS